MTSESVSVKAQRLRDQGKVTRIDQASVYVVRGDHGSYLVAAVPGKPMLCTCRTPPEVLCSHRAAVAAEIEEA